MCEGASKQTPGLKILPCRDRAPPFWNSWIRYWHSMVNSLPESPSLGLVTGKSGSLSSIFFCWTCVVGCSNTSCVLNNCSGLVGIGTGGGMKGANFNRFLGNLAFLLIGLFVAVSLFTLPVLQIMKQKIFLITLTK